MLTRVTRCLTEPELNALRTLAEREMRGLRGALPADAAIGEWMLG